MRLAFSAAIAAVALSIGVTAAKAEPVTFASSAAGGASYVVGLALAKELSAQGIDMRVTPMRSTTQAVPLVSSGEVEAAAANAFELVDAMKGKGVFSGHPMNNLRIIGNIYPYWLTYSVKKDDPARSVADLKGKRLPHGFRATSTGDLTMTAILVAAGLSYRDVTPVEVTEFSGSRDAFLAGRLDAYHFVLGSGANVSVAQKVGGLRALTVTNEPEEAASRLKAFGGPALRIAHVAAGTVLGVDDDINVLAYDYMLYTSADTPDDLVEKIATVLISDAKRMSETAKGFKWFDPEHVGADNGIPFHPAALKVYRKFGLPVSGQ